ncbi:HVSL domain-containing protein [Nonomuraea basaltis]|uniref:HVSL domain-containing protein n=1 Tax=Nonomuraea basaltis TaxID=2495887 RepID=UPI001F0FEC78|nr:HVSL domain-containing protein [Nonomuraea basaltis]
MSAGSVSPGLLATPTAWLGRREAHSIGDPQRWTNPDRSNELSDQIAYLLLPTPLASMQGPSRRELEAGNPRRRLEAAVALLPTPRATDGTKGGPNQRGSSGDLMLPSAVHQIGASTPPPSHGGRKRPATPHPGQLSLDAMDDPG